MVLTGCRVSTTGVMLSAEVGLLKVKEARDVRGAASLAKKLGQDLLSSCVSLAQLLASRRPEAKRPPATLSAPQTT